MGAAGGLCPPHRGRHVTENVPDRGALGERVRRPTGGQGPADGGLVAGAVGMTPRGVWGLGGTPRDKRPTRKDVVVPGR